MIWFLSLHIIGLLFWAAALLYLPGLIVGSLDRRNVMEEPEERAASLSRFVFTHVGTPAALLAIFAGTATFIVDYRVDVWLMAKLTLVSLMAVAHCLVGLLIIRAERGKTVRLWCWVVGLFSAVLATLIVWIVLAKPPLETWLEGWL
jgi:protoporphyrinogen IX oxidase